VKHSRCKDRGLLGLRDSETCMDSATANCSRRSPGVEILRAGSLLGRVMFLEGSWMLRRLFVFGCSATVRVSKAGYIMLQYSLRIEQPKNAFDVVCDMR